MPEQKIDKEKLSPEAQEVLDRAKQIAEEREGESRVDTGDILAALIDGSYNISQEFITAFQVEGAALRGAAASAFDSTEEAAEEVGEFTAKAARAIGDAIEEGVDEGREGLADASHLLARIMDDTESAASKAVRSMGVARDRILDFFRR